MRITPRGGKYATAWPTLNLGERIVFTPSHFSLMRPTLIGADVASLLA